MQTPPAWLEKDAVLCPAPLNGCRAIQHPTLRINLKALQDHFTRKIQLQEDLREKHKREGAAKLGSNYK